MIELASSHHHSVVTTAVNWLDSHQGTAVALLTVALVVVTTYYAIQNRRMAAEMQRANRLAVEQRDEDRHREQLRELRTVTDDAAEALSDLWTILAAFAHAVPTGDPPVSHRSPTEHHEPDARQFIEAYNRLRYVHLRLMNRVERSDTFHFGVGRALSDVQGAYNAVVHQDPHALRDRKSEQAIRRAIVTVQRALREIQDKSRERFAPLGLPESQYVALLVLRVKQRGPETESIVMALRSDPERQGKVTGPDQGGVIIVRDDESQRGEARIRLTNSLDAADSNWRNYIELQPETDAEMQAWVRRAAIRQTLTQPQAHETPVKRRWRLRWSRG